MRGLPDEDTRDGVSPLADVEKLVIEGRYGRADLALRRLEALIPGLATATDTETLLLALYGRALLLRQLGAGTQNAIAACDVLERAAHEREAELWVATACATRARFRVDSGDIGGATADLARADAEAATGDLTNDTGYRLLDGLALVYSGLRLNDRADEMRSRIEHSIGERRVLDQAQHWSTWSGELAARAMEPLAGGAQEPQHELMGRAIEIAAKLDELPEDDVPSTLRRGARGVRALSAAYRGRPSEALRLLGPDAFGTVGDLPLVERQIVSLAAMRAHALVGSLATARSLDDAAAGAAPTTLPNLVLEVCRTRERLWLETYAGGDVIPVLHRMTELLVRLGWRGMDLVADTARQALEHQALRTESRTDALTGVGNRRALDEELRQLLRFGPLPLSLILVDIDHFKGVNDVFTHVVGDEVLKRVAASLSLQLRTDDQLLRYGGDEFVVLLPGTGDEEADAVADRMRAAVRDRPWGELAEGLQVSVTTGVAAVWSLSGRRPDADAEKLFRRADERLLEGKRSRPEDGGDDSRSTGSTDITVVVSADADRIDDLPVRDDDSLSAHQPAAISASASSEPDTAGIPAIGWRDSTAAEPDPLLDDSPHWSSSAIDDEDQEEDDDTSGPEPLPAAPAAWQLPSSTPARSRTSNRVAMRPQSPPERRTRSAFDPDPDDDLDLEALGAGPAQRTSGRRDAHPRAIEGQEDAERSSLNALAPIRSRREARAASRPDIDSLHETSASRDAAEADAAAREVAKAQAEDARKRAAREARARDDAARDAEIRLRAEQEKLAREADLRERAAQERQARERAAREKAQRQAAETEAREKAARERAAQERAAREAAQVAAREAAEAAAREAAENAAREAAEVAAREAAEKAAREAAENERRRAAERIRAERERREAEARERERREAAARAERERREAEARERERHEAAARAERERREAEARERARHEAAIRAERERREAEARARTERERLQRERLEQERLVKERHEREMREAEIRDAERLRQEARDRAEAEAQARMAAIEQAEAETEARVVAIEQARVRAEAEAERARASDQIREEAYARAAELARRASSGPIPHLTSVPGYDDSSYDDDASYDDSPYDDVQGPAASGRQLQRRAPLYDASRQPDEDGVEPFRERRSHPRPTSSPSGNPAARGGQSGHTQPNPTPPRFGQNGSGQNGVGHNGAAQNGAAQNGSGQNGFNQNRFSQNGAGQNGFDRNGFDRNGFDHNGYDHNGYDRSGFDHNGYDQNGYDTNGYDQNGAGPNGFGQIGAGPNGFGQPGAGQNGAGQNGVGQNGFGHNGFGHNGAGRNGTAANGTGPNGQGRNGQGRNGVSKNRLGQNVPGQNIPTEGAEDDPDSPETIAIRTRREPFGPPTRSQAIIDLSARKRPRNPYSS